MLPGKRDLFLLPLLLSFSAVSQVAVKGRGKAFPSEQHSAIKQSKHKARWIQACAAISDLYRRRRRH